MPKIKVVVNSLNTDWSQTNYQITMDQKYVVIVDEIHATILERTNKKKCEWHYKPKNDCPYFVLLARKSADANKTNPCTNYIEHCEVWMEVQHETSF